MELKVKLNREGVKAPVRANPTDAGADLFAPFTTVIPPYSHIFIDFGISIELPKNTVGYIFARSSLGSKFGIRPRNCVGVIDEKYRGNLGIMLENHSEDEICITKGDRIAQLVVSPIFTPEIKVVDELDMTDDRQGGFGSTGK